MESLPALPLQYLQYHLETFICHLAAAVPVLGTDKTSPVRQDMICFNGVYLKKSRSQAAGSIFGQSIDISFGPNRAQL